MAPLEPAGGDPYGRMARFYDDDYAAAGRDEDIAFYTSLAAETGGPVLEMGCGSGRNLLPIARSGIAVHGVDSSPAMLRALRDKLRLEPPDVRGRVRVTPGDIRTTRLAERFRLVTAPFRVAQHLLHLDDRRAWLRNVARHLEADGSFCFDVLNPDPDLLSRPHENDRAIERAIPSTSQVVVRGVRTRPGAIPGALEVDYTWRVERADIATTEESHARLVFHLYTRSELESLLAEAGFEIRAYWGSFGRESFGPDSTDHVILCRQRSY